MRQKKMKIVSRAILCQDHKKSQRTQYTHSVLIRNGLIRNTSEILGFLKT